MGFSMLSPFRSMGSRGDRSSSPQPPEANPGGHGPRWRRKISRVPAPRGIVPRRPYEEDLMGHDYPSEGTQTQA